MSSKIFACIYKYKIASIVPLTVLAVPSNTPCIKPNTRIPRHCANAYIKPTLLGSNCFEFCMNDIISMNYFKACKKGSVANN